MRIKEGSNIEIKRGEVVYFCMLERANLLE